MRANFVTAVALLVAVAALVEPIAQAQDSERFNVPVAASDPQVGPSGALVTVVTFTEFQCPFCSRVQPTLRTLRERYGQDIRFVFRHNPLPFHDHAMPAAELAMEAYAQQGSQGFWRAHDLLFQNQRALTRPDLERYAVELRLDLGRVRAALDQHTHQARIEADMALARQLGARGTPAFFINGIQLMGAQPVEQFVAVIDEERAHAAQLVQNGVDPAQLYATIVRRGRTQAPEPTPGAPAPPSPARRRENPDAIYRVPVTSAQPVLGRRDALVTIVVFADFQCPFSARVQPTLTELRERYGAQLRIVWRDNPLDFHPGAMPAAILAREVFASRGSDYFWRAHEQLFRNQADLSDTTLDRISSELGVEPSRWRAAQQRGTHTAVIEADRALARQLGASGTPSFFINGVKLRGAQPIESFAVVIDAQLRLARDAIRSGRARASDVYDVLTRDGATAPVMIDGAPSAAGPPPDPPPDHVYELPLPRSAPSLGPARATFVIQWFADLQCPFTSRVFPTLRALLAAYPNDVRIVWRDYPLPFHTQAAPAAEAVREVYARHGNDGFWRAVTYLFENQRRWYGNDDGLWAVLAEVQGIDAARIRAAVQSGRHRAAVQADIDAVSTAGARIGTPSFFLDGRLQQGAQPIESFRAMIDAAGARRQADGARPEPARRRRR